MDMDMLADLGRGCFGSAQSGDAVEETASATWQGKLGQRQTDVTHKIERFKF
jgi:hypothetical protein